MIMGGLIILKIYGLKKSLRAWYGRIYSFLTSLGFTKSRVNPNLYFKIMDDEHAILLLYADDFFLTWNEKQIEYLKKNLAQKFEMKYLGLMHYFLGLEVCQRLEGIFLTQGKYAMEILKIFDMLDCKAMATPMDTNLKLLLDKS